MGWIDGNGDGGMAIALRCGQLSETDPRQIRLYAGCGSWRGPTLRGAGRVERQADPNAGLARLVEVPVEEGDRPLD